MTKKDFTELYGDFYWNLQDEYFVQTKCGNFIIKIVYDINKPHIIKKTNSTLKLWAGVNPYFSCGIIKICEVFKETDFILMVD